MKDEYMYLILYKMNINRQNERIIHLSHFV